MWALASAALQGRPKVESGTSLMGSDLAPGTTAATRGLQTEQQAAETHKSSIDGGLPEWKRRMIEKNEAAKKEVTDIMDDSLKRVMAQAEAKPEAQRAKAVDSYVSAVDWIMWSVTTVIARVK